MEFFQKKGKNVHSYKLETDHLKLFMKSSSSKGEYSIPYDSITSEKIEITEQNDNFKNYSIYLAVVSVIAILLLVLFNVRTSFPIFIIGAVVLYILYIRSKVVFTGLVGNRNVYIIQDDQHDEILDAIYKARTNYMKKEYGQVNVKNDPQKEVEKFKWLLNQKIISQSEFNETRAKILRLD